MAAFVERYCITETPTPQPTAAPEKVIQHSPLREAECHLAEVLVKFAQLLHVCAKDLASGESSCFVLVDTLKIAIDELDGRNRGLLLHTEVDHEYERRRQLFPKVCRQAVTAATAIRQIRRQIWECQKLGLEITTATPLIRMLEQTIILLFTIARGLERDNQDMRDCIEEALKQFENHWCKMESILTSSCYNLPTELGKSLRQTVSLLGGAVHAIYVMVEMVFNIVPEEVPPQGHLPLLPPDLPTPFLTQTSARVNRSPVPKLSSLPLPRQPTAHWLKALFVRH